MDGTKITAKVVAAVVVTAAVILGTILYRRKRRVVIPENWTEVGELKDLMCFPIKSCGVIRLNLMKCSDIGLTLGLIKDRSFAVVDAKNNFISARVHPKLVLIKPSVVNDDLVLEAPEMPALKINIPSLNKAKKFQVTVWGIANDSKDCGDEAAEWLSRFLLDAPSGLRLGLYSKDKHGTSREKKYIKNEDSGIFGDLTSYNLINESSVDDLMTRIEDGTVIKPQNFRPNFVVKGAAPLDEDYWRWVKIGDTVFEVVRQCTRCVLTTVDPETGVKNVSGEPLKTLRTYRKIGDPKIKDFDKSTPVMGVHLALRQGGEVSIGDRVYIVK